MCSTRPIAAFWIGSRRQSLMEFASIIPMGCAILSSISQRLRERAPDAWIVGEKILRARRIASRAAGRFEGTTGYDFLNVCNCLLMHPAMGLKELTEIYKDFHARAD